MIDIGGGLMKSNMFRKKMHLNIIIVSVTMFLLSISVSLINNDMNHVNNYNNMYLKNNIKVLINNNIDNIIKELAINKDISILSEKSIFINGSNSKGVYFESVPIDIPIGEGRNFTYKDIKERNKAIIIGREFKHLVKEDNGEKYINVYGEKYEVIGITNNDVLKYDVFVNLDLIDAGAMGSEFIICSNTLTEKELVEVIYKCEDKYPESIEISQNKLSKFTIEDVFERYSQIIENYLTMIIVSTLALITSTMFLADKIKSEIYIKTLCGATKKGIASIIIKKASTIGIISAIVSYISQIILSKISIVYNIGYYDMDIYNLLLLLGIIILVNIMLFVSCIKFFRLKSISAALKET